MWIIAVDNEMKQLVVQANTEKMIVDDKRLKPRCQAQLMVIMHTALQGADGHSC